MPTDYLYGAASSGGAKGSGTIFRVRLDGTRFRDRCTAFRRWSTSTDELSTNADGATPVAGLTDGGDGRLYGVASLGGSTGIGTRVRARPGRRRVHGAAHFDGADGRAADRRTAARRWTAQLVRHDRPVAPTRTATTTTFGTIFSIARDGTGFASLYSFDGTDGSAPTGRLLQLDATTFVGVDAGRRPVRRRARVYQFSLTGATVDGITNCGRKNKNSGGGGDRAGTAAAARRRRSPARRLRGADRRLEGSGR